jgi:hypothetical protein
MPVKTKKTTRSKKAKGTKKPAPRAPAKKAKKPASKITAKKAVAKTARATKTVKKQEQGKREPAKQSSKKAASKRVTTRPTEKTAWRISPEISQSVLQIDTWKKDDLRIEHLKVYRTGWIIVEQLPDLGGYNPDEGINIFEEFEFDEYQLYDGAKEASIFPTEVPTEERERLLARSEAGLEDEGWTLESATRFKGPLLVEHL